MTDEETVARRMAARKMGLVKDPYGERLPDDLWQQMIPAARAFLDDLAHELYSSERRAQALSDLAEHDADFL